MLSSSDSELESSSLKSGAGTAYFRVGHVLCGAVARDDDAMAVTGATDNTVSGCGPLPDLPTRSETETAANWLKRPSTQVGHAADLQKCAFAD